MNTFRSIKIWMTLVVLLGVASTTQAATINLAWNPNTETNLAGYSVSYGTQSGASTTTIDVGNNASPLLTNLVNGTRYYFTVKAYNTSAMYSAPSAEISGMAVDVPPTSPAAPAPASGATGVALTGTLSWAASTYATQYDVAFGTTNPPPVVSSNQTSTTYQSNWLVPGTTYYWQIVAKGPGGSTSGAIWSFATGANASRPLPVAAYSFNEGTGTATNDASGNGRTGALTNATWTSTGKNGGALSFNGSSSRVTVTDSAALRLSTAMTLEAWINPSGAGAPDWQAIMYKGLDNYALATIGANLPTAVGTVGGGLAMATSASTLPFNTWTHLATTYDGATVRLFVNGTQVASQPATGVFDVSTNPLEIGGSLADLGPFAGLIDDVRVYNTALTPAQIQADMTTPVAAVSDTQAPTAPTTLTVSAVSTTQLALTWTASTDNVGVTGYRIERCAGAGCTTFSQVGTATAASYSDAGLVASTSYTYRVRATDAANNLGSYSSAASAATLTPTPAPAVPAGPTPVSSATGIPMTVALSWAASANATQYDVAFGTTTPPAVVSSNRTTTSYQPLALTAGTTYYWQIVAKGAGGSTSGPVWNFTMLPAPTAPAGPTPTISATSVPLTVALSWAASANTTQYDVAFGTTNPPTIISSNQTATTYQPAALTAGTQYYWQVVAKGACGTTSGPVWSFTTLSVPAAPAGPTPASSATGVSLTPTLSWTASTNATQYDVAFGTTNPPAVVSSNQAPTTYQPAALIAGKTYYWQVIAKGTGGSTSGSVWSFTTAAAAARPVPVAAYAFNEGAGTTTSDASGNGRTGALSNATWTSAGKNGGALSFNGTSSRVTVADSTALHLSTGMTLEAWINPSGAGAPYWQAIIYKGLDNYLLATLGSNQPMAAGTIGGGLPMPTSASTLSFNTWTHLATTYDGATVRLFVNGTQVASRPATGVFDVSTNPLEIGGSLVDLGAFAGLIDDVRVYNTPLTLAQIQTDMTTPVATASDTQAPTAPTTLTVSAVSTTQLALTWAASTDNVGVTGYRIERCAGAGCTAFSQVGTATTANYSDAVLVASTSYTYRVRATDVANNLGSYSPAASATTLTPTPAPTAPAGPTPASGSVGVSLTPTLSWIASTNATQYDVAFGTTNSPAVVSSNQTSTAYQPVALTAGTTYYWQVVAKGPGGSVSGAVWSFTTAAAAARPVPVAAYAFNEGAGTTTSDASGNGRTGALTNATWTSAGKNGGALSFNGSSSRVTVADSAALRLSTAMTLEAWINPSGAGAPDWQAIIYKGLDNYALATIGANLPTAAAMIGGGLAMATSANTVPFNTWTHLATTYDGATVRLFVNGTQVASRPATGVFDVSTNPLEIGGSLVDLGPFAGLIDDVRVYNTALTLAQIQTDMTTPVTTATQSAAPTAPSGPLPANGATSVLTTIALNWTASTNAVQYDVAFGTTNPPPTVATNLGTTFYQPTTAFTNGITYFWRVIAKGAGGTTSGPVWSFTAQPAAAAGLAASSSTSSEAQLLRLMTWNVNGGNSLTGAPNVDAQVAVMANSGAQVIALQGVTVSTVGDLSALYKSKLENVTSRTWNTLWIPDPRLASAKPEGNLFLTTLPIVSSATTELDSAPITPTLLDAKRSAGWIGVVFNNVTVYVATAQLAVDATQRAAQLVQLGSWIAAVPKPRLIGGDFNMLPGDATYQKMSSGFADVWTAIVKTGDPGTTQNASPVGRVDYWWSELTDQHATPSAIKVVETSSSTHFAVVMDANVR